MRLDVSAIEEEERQWVVVLVNGTSFPEGVVAGELDLLFIGTQANLKNCPNG